MSRQKRTQHPGQPHPSPEFYYLAWDTFLQAHPGGALLSWVTRNHTTSFKEVGEDIWMLTIYLEKRRELLPGEAWVS